MTSGPVSRPQPVSSKPPPQEISEEEYYNQKDLLKAIRETFGGLAVYESTI